MRTGHRAILEQFVADGLTTIFGNPGTVEQGLLDAIEDFPALSYVLTLQESVAVMAADAHARATRRPSVVQIHSSPGLGNAIGALYQAQRGRSPLVVIGGDAGISFQNLEAQMAADLVGMARPVTKWSTMVLDPRSLLRTLRRAIKVAATHPMGPVYVCLPQDILDAEAVEAVVPTLIPELAGTPSAGFIAVAAAELVAAERPHLFVGDGVAWSRAQPELSRLAELLGAEVWGVDSGEVNMAADHPCWRGQTGHMFGFQSAPILAKADVSLIVGSYVLPEVFPELGPVFAPGARVIHIDSDPGNIGKNHPVDLAVIADPKAALASLSDAVAALQTESAALSARARVAGFAEAAAASRAAQRTKDADRKGEPLHFSQFMQVLGPRLPADAVVYDEALTNSPDLTRYLPALAPDSFFQVRGGSLGTAMAGGIGLAMAHRHRPVFAFSGDGGAMYTIQALWTAARNNLNAKFVICSNRSYRLLQANLSQFWSERGVDGREFPLSFDLSKPEIDFATLARGMGVTALTVSRESEIVASVETFLKTTGPCLIDVILAGDVRPELIGVACGH